MKYFIVFSLFSSVFGEVIDCMRPSVTLAYDFSAGSLDATRGGVTATQVNESNPVTFDGGGIRIGGPDASGLNLGFVDGGDGGFTVHVVMSLHPEADDERMYPFSIYDGDPGAGFDENKLTAVPRIRHVGTDNDEIEWDVYAVQSEDFGELDTRVSFNASLPDPILFSFSVWNTSFWAAAYPSMNGKLMLHNAYLWGNQQITIDALRGNLFLGILWPENVDTPPRHYSTIHAVYFDTTPLDFSVGQFSDFVSCFPEPETTTTTLHSSTSTLPGSTTTSTTIMITGGGVGDGVSAVRVGGEKDGGSTSSASPLTVALILLGVVVFVCALAFGLLVLARSRRRRHQAHLEMTKQMTLEKVDGDRPSGEGRSRSRSRSRRSSQSRTKASASTEYVSIVVPEDEYSSMPTMESSRDSSYRPLQDESSDAGYAAMPQVDQRTHAYGMPIEARTEGGDTVIDPTYATGELSMN
jgi:multisubunit Na+/H+ antiporter MnhC subunit